MEKTKKTSQPGRITGKGKGANDNDTSLFKKKTPRGKGDMDFGHDPEKKVEIDDDPGGTQKKIPRMKY